MAQASGQPSGQLKTADRDPVGAAQDMDLHRPIKGEVRGTVNRGQLLLSHALGEPVVEQIVGRLARAIRRITEEPDRWWTAGRNDQVRRGVQPGTYRIWLPVDSVSSVLWFARPEHEDDMWYLSVGYDRVIPEPPIDVAD